jgi:hypothetical protein
MTAGQTDTARSMGVGVAKRRNPTFSRQKCRQAISKLCLSSRMPPVFSKGLSCLSFSQPAQSFSIVLQQFFAFMVLSFHSLGISGSSFYICNRQHGRYKQDGGG